MTGPRHKRTRWMSVGALGVAAVVSLSGCTMPFATPAAAPSIVPSPLAAAPSSAVPLPPPTGPAPALINTGTGWAPIIASLLTYSQWLLANPGTGSVSVVAAAGCPLTAELTKQVTGLSGEGWRLAPVPLTISSIGVPAGLGAGQSTVTLLVDASRGAEAVVDGAGQATSGVGTLPPTTFDVTVVLGGDGKWRLCSADPAPSPTIASPASRSLF